MRSNEPLNLHQVQTPANKRVRSVVHHAMYSEYVRNDFPLVWVFWADGTMLYPDHDRFPIVRRTPGGWVNTYVSTASMFEPLLTLPELESRPTESGDPALGWPDGQTVTCCHGGYLSSEGYTGSCHPPRLFARPNHILGSPRCVRIIACNYDRDFRYHDALSARHVQLKIPNSGEVISLADPPPFLVGNWLALNKPNTIQSTFFYYEGYFDLIGLTPGSPFTEQYARDWTRTQLQFDEKWRAATADLKSRFPQLLFQFVPCTPGGVLTRVLETSRTLSGRDDQALLTEWAGRDWDSDPSELQLEGDPLGAALLPRSVQVALGQEVADPDCYPAGYLYGDVLNIIVIRASTANSVPPYWLLEPIEGQLGVEAFEPSLVGIDPQIAGRIREEIPKHGRHKTVVLMDDGRLNLQGIFWGVLEESGGGEFACHEVWGWHCSTPAASRTPFLVHLYVDIGGTFVDAYDYANGAIRQDVVDQYLAQIDEPFEDYEYDPDLQAGLRYHVPIKVQRFRHSSSTYYKYEVINYTNINLVGADYRNNAFGELCAPPPFFYPLGFGTLAPGRGLRRHSDSAEDSLVFDAGYALDMRETTERMLQELSDRQDIPMSFGGRINIDAPGTKLAQIITEFYGDEPIS